MANNVTGPSSALTSFLREHGITAPRNPYRRIRDQNQNQEAGEASSSATPAPAEASTSSANNTPASASRSRSRRTSGYVSDNLDSDGDEPPAPKKRKLTAAATAKLKAKEKVKRKKAGLGSDAEDDDGEEDEYTAPSKGIQKGAIPGAPPPIGSLQDCAKCEIEFTVTRYTMAAVPPPGWLCHDCAKASGVDPFKRKPAAPRKRKAAADKRKVVNFEAIASVPTLASLCIKIISDNIEDVEALGDIGAENMTNISRILAKNRSLTAENAQLFYSVKNKKLCIYDTTNLEPAALCTLASLNPNLEELRLDFCGRIEDTAMHHWIDHFEHLKRLDLLGPFLVRADAWVKLFEGKGAQLEGFLIIQSPRFDQACIEALGEHCKSLTDLRLSQISKMSDDFLPHIAKLQHLTSLDLSAPAHSLSDEAVVELLEHVGSKLVSLDLSGNVELTDAFLKDGMRTLVPNLTTLVLNNLPSITDIGVSDLFDTYVSNSHPPLDKISLSRNHNLAGDALTSLLQHSGFALVELDINSWKDVSQDALKLIGDHAKVLQTLDMGWCRSVDDFIVKGVLDGCERLKAMKVYGCNRLTQACPYKRGVAIMGIETNTFN